MIVAFKLESAWRNITRTGMLLLPSVFELLLGSLTYDRYCFIELGIKKI